MEILNNEKSNLFKAVLSLVVILALYFAVKTVAEIKNYHFIGGGASASSTISFSGEGEVFAVPDIANISLTIREKAKVVKEAQTKVTNKEKAVLSFLEKSGIEKKDIKTESYNTYPEYDYVNSVCPTPMPMSDRMGVSTPVYCPPGKQILTGYQVSEYITVKIRDIEKAGEILAGVGAVGVTEMNGPNFSIENEDELQGQARKMAIDEAKAKAEALAKDLGVRLVRIVNFSESGDYPIYYATKGMGMADSVVSSAPAPELPTGENKIISNVTITYEIR